MIIDASNYPNLKDAIAEAERVKYKGGSTLYIPGRESPYDADQVIWPSNTAIYGDGYGSRLTGNSTLSSHMGTEISNLSIEGEFHLLNARTVLLKSIVFRSLVTLSGSSYYNKFDMCNWYSVDRMMEVIGTCNFNAITKCRVSHENIGLKFTSDSGGQYANGWTIRESSFEGNHTNNPNEIGAAHWVNGKNHKFIDNWYEAGANKPWNPYTVVFDDNAYGCTIEDGVRGYQFSVRDKSNSNKW